MNGETKAKLALVVGVIVFGCYAVASMLQPQKTKGEMISMVEPCASTWCAEYDAHYAQEVNRPNSEANRNNGQAAQSFAQATQTVWDAGEGQSTYTMLGMGLGAICTIGALVTLAFVGFVVWARRGS